MPQLILNYARIECAIHFIREHYTEQPELVDVARHVGLSVSHMQRLFQKWAGVSPKTFLQYITTMQAGALLRNGMSVLDSAYAVGLSGTGRLHDHFVKVHAMRPGQFGRRGAGLLLQYGFYESLFGTVLAASSDYGLVHLSFADNRKHQLQYLHDLLPEACLQNDKGNQVGLVNNIFQLNEDSPHNPIQLHLQGTAFQVQVWQALLRIPAGSLVAYKQVAAAAGKERAVRAAASAVANNPIAYLIPCHRVIRQNGTINQYRWGSTRKAAMIAYELSPEHDTILNH